MGRGGLKRVEELGRGVFAGGGHFTGGFHDSVVGFLRGRFIAGDNGVEFGECEFLAGLEVGVDFPDLVGFAVETFQRAARDVQAKAAFGARFAYTLEDGLVDFVAEASRRVARVRLPLVWRMRFVFS